MTPSLYLCFIASLISNKDIGTVSCSFVQLCCVMPLVSSFLVLQAIPISPFHYEEMIDPLVQISCLYCWRAGATRHGIFRRCWRAVSTQFSFLEARHIYLSPLQNGDWAGEQNGTYLCFNSSVVVAPGSWQQYICTSNPIFLSCTFEWRLGRGIASASHRRLQRMPSTGGEFSRWPVRWIGAYRERQRKRVTKPRMRTYTTYAVVRSKERLGWLTPVRQ